MITQLYFGEISAFGDTVKIIKEPHITAYDYTRGTDTPQTMLTDEELILVVDQARAFKFIVDDIEKSMSHVNWVDTASRSAAYTLKDGYDRNVFTYIGNNVDSAMTIGADDATAEPLPDVNSSTSVYLGYGSGMTDPLDLLSRFSRMFDENNVPEEGRWIVADPAFYEILIASASKLINSDYNAGQGSIRNGLVSSGLLRGFAMYKSNNLPTTAAAEGTVYAGHISAVASAETLINTEVLRDQHSFGDIVRGLHVFGRKVLREEALAKAFWSSKSDT